MLKIQNDHLVVEVLDPLSDQAYLGTRYCSGGYIFQVTDRRLGPLLAGPTYPESYNVFDGQGIPDSFNLAPLRGAEDGQALVLGVGVCDLTDNTVNEPCVWSIEETTRSLTFTTRHIFQGWVVDLERRITLEGRTVQSNTLVRNASVDRFRIVWFPHPFFPQEPAGADDLIKVNLALTLPENESFELSRSGYIRRKGWPWTDGHYHALNFAQNRELVVIQRHPSLGQVSASCNYAPTYFPIWGNANTFSWEPMIERTIASAQVADWQIHYNF